MNSSRSDIQYPQHLKPSLETRTPGTHKERHRNAADGQMNGQPTPRPRSRHSPFQAGPWYAYVRTSSTSTMSLKPFPQIQCLFSKLCNCTNSLYLPLSVINSPCVPLSTTTPLSIT